MGRPINKRFLGDKAGAIRVSHYHRAGNGNNIQSGTDTTYIISQKSTNKFWIGDSDSSGSNTPWTELMTLVDKPATGNSALGEGEFSITANNPEGSVDNVTRLYNNTLRLGDNEKVAWSIKSPAPVSITGVAAFVAGETIKIQVANDDIDKFTTGDVVTISKIVGTTQLNDRTFTVGAVDSTSSTKNFELLGETYTAAAGGTPASHTAWSSGGTVTGIGSLGYIDTQTA